MNSLELGQLLKERYQNARQGEQVASIHLFGIEFGNIIRENNIEIKSIIENADLSLSYQTELSKGVKLSKLGAVYGSTSNKIFLKKNKNMALNLNQILYGPPGTGKTYNINRLKNNFIVKKDSISRQEWASKIVENLTWWEVVALALYDLGSRTIVPEISNHELILAKADFHNKEKGISQQIWAALQTHTVLESQSVKYKARVEPLVFEKIEKSNWIFVDDYADKIPELLEVYDKYKNQKPLSQELHNYEFVTFHQSYGYEEFMEGIKAIPAGEKGNEDGLEMIYKVSDGIFKKLSKKAQENPQHKYAIFIDEINRGNISKIFGELITLIEPSKRIGAQEEIRLRLPYSNELFGVPSNLYIIGTMNTADRSIALMDTALRRRFEFVEMMPDYGVLENEVGVVAGVDIAQLLQKINARVEYLYDRDHAIGHAYFMELNAASSLDELNAVMRNKIIPLLQEYFYDDWEKIRLVLNDGFVHKSELSSTKIFGKNIDDDYVEEKYLYSITEEFTQESYLKIYDTLTKIPEDS